MLQHVQLSDIDTYANIEYAGQGRVKKARENVSMETSIAEDSVEVINANLRIMNTLSDIINNLFYLNTLNFHD